MGVAYTIMVYSWFRIYQPISVQTDIRCSQDLPVIISDTSDSVSGSLTFEQAVMKTSIIIGVMVQVLF